MFQCIKKVLSKNTFQFQIKQNDILLSFEQVIFLWKSSQNFRAFYTQILRAVPFSAFFWENKAVTNSSLQQTYEFVLVGTSAFDNIKSNSKPFQSYFSTKDTVVSFDNLGKNARLVVPCSSISNENYTHLATFIRNAPDTQIDAFWQQIGVEIEQNINNKPLWLSTSGLGVYWLHARLDQRPKYYTHTAYKSV